MISFALTSEQSLILETVRSFAFEVLRPAARAADESESLPESLLAQAWSLGIVAAQLPEAHGGSAQRSPLTSALVLEALAYGDPALALAIAHVAAFASTIAEQGSEAQREHLLPKFCGNDFTASALAVMEPTALFEPSRIATRARASDAGFALSGTKCCVPLADRASHFLVLARADSGQLQAFIVARDAAGLTITREHNLGLRALPTGQLSLSDVEVAKNERLGGAAGEFDATRLLATAHTASAALLLGLGCAVMDYAVAYAKERRAFGSFIAQKQAVAFMLANMRIQTDALRWLTWKAASQLERGASAWRSASAARNYAAEHVMRIADDGLQVLGGHGYIREHPLELWYRSARTLSVLDGVACV